MGFFYCLYPYSPYSPLKSSERLPCISCGPRAVFLGPSTSFHKVTAQVWQMFFSSER